MSALLFPCVFAIAAPGGPTLTVGQDSGDFVGDTNEAIQQAIDIVAARDGGEVVIKAGEYTAHNSVMLRSNVTLRGEGHVVITKDPGFVVPLTSDCGYGYNRVKVDEPGRWRVGWGVTLKDERNPSGFNAHVSTVVAIEGDDLVLAEDAPEDYCVTRKATVAHTFPVIAGYRCTNSKVINITCDGNRAQNELLDGCRGGAIYFFRSENCEVRLCTGRDFHGDGISFQISPHTLVSHCKSYGNTHLGLHPGSGSHHSEISHSEAYDNGGDGLFLCWRVAHSRFEGNHVHDNGGHGVSIGHKDTDNVFTQHVIENNRGYGVYFRPEPEYNAGHRCTFEDNIIRNNSDKDGAAVWIDGDTTGTRLFRNVIADDRGDVAPACAIYVGASASDVQAEGNRVAGFGELVKSDSKAADVVVGP